MFLSWDSPWPAHSGAALRTLGLLKVLGKAFDVELVLLTRQPLSADQIAYLQGYALSVTRVPLCDVSTMQKFSVAGRMAQLGYPYHSAVLETSLQGHAGLRETITHFPGIVFTSTGHWGTLVRDRPAPNWILNQCDADVEFWRVYATQAAKRLARLAAQINYRLARRHYPPIYANVGRVISVCEEDRQHTLTLAPCAQVDVIENGVDCTYLTPDRTPHKDRPRLLFTGTSAGRNMTALRQFVRNVLPLIQEQVPDIELLVAGNFSPQAQMEFRSFAALRFTGRVDDMRPFFDQSDVFVAPFGETHGSKLKVAEAMAMAMPIVSTPAGIRGFPLRDGESVRVAQDNEQFAVHVVALLSDLAYRERLGSLARQVAVSTVDWAVLGEKLREIVTEVTLSRERI